MIDRAIMHAFSIGLFVFTWMHFAVTNNPFVFFPLLAICCFTLYAGNMLPVKYRNLYSRVTLTGFLFTFSNLLDEFLFDPKKLQANEIIALLIIIILVVRGRGKERDKTGHW